MDTDCRKRGATETRSKTPGFVKASLMSRFSVLGHQKDEGEGNQTPGTYIRVYFN